MKLRDSFGGFFLLAMFGFGLVACGGGSGSSASDTPPVLGTACTRADVVVHLDASNSDARCSRGSDGNLVWVDEKPGSSASNSSASFGLNSSAEIPSVMETVGFDLAPFDAASGMAGAMKIAGVVPPKVPANDPNSVEVNDRNQYLFLPFGYSEKNDTDPQWAFYLPLGTPVLSLISGTVCDVPILYSNDYSIRVVPDGTTCDGAGRAPILFETEHVIDPLVKFGDRVTAGQRIATVSDYDRSWKAIGYGIVEIGIAYNLGNDGSPWHACPSRFFAPNAKNAMLNSLTSLMTAWSAQVGNPALYASASSPEPGCFMADVHN